MGTALRGSGRTLRDALDHAGGDPREHGLGLRRLQYIDDRVRPLRLLLRLEATACAISQFEKASAVAKLGRLASASVSGKGGAREGNLSARQSPRLLPSHASSAGGSQSVHQLSLREVSNLLAAQGFLNERGKPYVAIIAA